MMLGTVLRKWRLGEELTLKDVAKEIGIPLSTLQRFEQGNPSEEGTLAAVICWLLGRGKAKP